jgi:anti-sigma B factor antagonist
MEIRLLDFPLDLFERALQHAAALQRELDVIRVDERHREGPPDRLARLVEELDLRFVGYRAAMEMLDALVTTHTGYHDVVIPVAGDPGEAAPAVEALRDLMDEVDVYCAEGGELLTPPMPPKLVAFRGWLFEQVIGQLRGGSATPWTAVASSPTGDERPAARASSIDIVHDGSTVTLQPTGDLDLVTAGRVRDAIYEAHAEHEGSLRIDLARVDFVDSVGLSVLVGAHKRFERDHRTLEIVVPEHLRANFEMSGLAAVLNLRSSR